MTGVSHLKSPATLFKPASLQRRRWNRNWNRSRSLESNSVNAANRARTLFATNHRERAMPASCGSKGWITGGALVRNDSVAEN